MLNELFGELSKILGHRSLIAVGATAPGDE